MKKIISISVNLLLALGTITFLPVNEVKPAYAVNKRISLAIIDFDNNSGVKEWNYMTKGVPRVLIANLAQNKGIKIVEREKLDKALKELKFSQSGFVSPETARKLGQIIGADYALYGSITRFGVNRPTIIVDATIMDIQTGEIKFVESVRGNDENAIINLLDKLSVMVLNDLVPEIEPNETKVTEEPKTKQNNKPIGENNISQISMSDKIVFTARDSRNSRHIFIGGSNGTVVRASEGQGNNDSPAWSPDGTKIAYVNQKLGVTIFDLKNNSNFRLSQKPVFDDSPKWTYDGNKIVFMTKEDKSYAIYSANKDGSSLIALSPAKTDVKSFDISKYNMIVYSAKVKNSWQIFMMDINGDNVRQLTDEGNNITPSWSPDGTRITFISDRDDYEKVYTMNSNATNQRKITQGEDDEETPIWSPDGAKIAFISIIKKKGKVSVINVDGTGQRVLTDDNSDNYDLTWLPNSSEVGFTSDGSIYTIKLTGSLKNMINVPSDDIEQPNWKK